jgi:hypothetical protein
MFRTSDPTHAIGIENGNVPKRNEFKIPRLVGCIISRTTTLAFGADALRILARNYLGNDASCIVLGGVKVNIGENEGLVIGNKIQYSA